uniref:HTH psq-type domain-containing protein n=1 Tax=Panagrolaimus sp. JU765 TaxID=591449 RepID=A0AC34Q612_9BILA
MATTVAINVPTPSSPEAGFTPSSGQNSPESAASPTSRLSTETTTKRKKKPYKELTLEEKVCLIKLAEENNCMSQASIAERYSIAKSNVCRILQRKQEYLRAFESAGFAGTRKRKLRKDLAISKSKKNEKKYSNFESNLDPIPKPIPIKPEVTVLAEEDTSCKPEETIPENAATSNLLHINAEGHKSAFQHLELPILCNPQLLVPHFVAAQYGYRPFDLPIVETGGDAQQKVGGI